MTLAKLAELAGVSTGTVSKAFSGSKEISEDTRQIVFSVAKKHGCFEKYYKPIFPKMVIAVLCPEIHSLFYSTIIRELEKKISDIGATMCLLVTEFSDQKTQELANYAVHYAHADALIVIGKEPILPEHSIPMVTFGGSKDDKNTNCIYSETNSAISDAVGYLKECGHKKIAFLGEVFTMSKLEGFQAAMMQHALYPEKKWIKVSEQRFEDAGYDAMEQLLKQEDLPTAIVTAYDNIAVGAMSCLSHYGYSVPADFSLIGMDDMPFSAYLPVPLTSIRLRTDELCEACIHLIQEKWKNKYYCPKEKITIFSELVIRNSVKNLKQERI